MTKTFVFECDPKTLTFECESGKLHFHLNKLKLSFKCVDMHLLTSLVTEHAPDELPSLAPTELFARSPVIVTTSDSPMEPRPVVGCVGQVRPRLGRCNHGGQS